MGVRSVVRMAAAKSGPPPAASAFAAASMPATIALDRQRHADHAGRGHGDLFGVEAERVGGDAAHARRVAEPALARAGVGVARVHDHAAQPLARRRAARQTHRRRRGGVRGEQHGRRARQVGDEHAEVAVAAALEAGVQAGRPEPARMGHRTAGLLDAGRQRDEAARRQQVAGVATLQRQRHGRGRPLARRLAGPLEHVMRVPSARGSRP